jgi:3-methylfumaryl-CoA hydratase
MKAAIDLEALRAWIGRTESRTDLVTAVPCAALSATLDRDDPYPQHGAKVPAAMALAVFFATVPA